MSATKPAVPQPSPPASAAEAAFQHLADANLFGIEFFTLDGRVYQVNDAWLRMVGYTREDIAAQPQLWRQITPPEYLHLDEQAFKELAERGTATPWEKEYIHKDGRHVTVLMSAIMLSERRDRGVCLVVDVTARHRAEAELARTNALLRSTLESTADGILVVDPEGRIVSANHRFGEMWRIPEAVLASRDDSAAIAWVLDQLRDPDGFIAKVKELYANKTASSYDVLHFKDGRVFERYSQPQVVDGKPTGRVWSFRDVTEHRLAEAALRESERRARALIENSSEGILTMSPDGVILWASPSATTMTGYALDRLRGMNIAELFHPDDLERVVDLVGKTLHEPHSRPRDRARIRHADSTWRTFEGTITNLLKESGIHALVVHFRDQTESLALQEQLAQAQKMDAIGRLAGGVAHDFNNLLTAIVGHAELLRDQIVKEDAALEDLGEIEKAAERAAGLTRQLLAFSRRQVLQPRVLDLDLIITGMQRMLQRLIGEDVRLEFVASGDAWVRADRSQMEQVVLNLVVNARDAMPRGGTIAVVTARQDLNDVVAHRLGLPVGRYVVLTVADTGHGMDPATQARVFEPFFTTRKDGTGLGLSTVYGVVRQSGGLIAVTSEPGRGTLFTVHLPWVEPPPELAREVAQTGEMPRGTETILLVEDEASVRDLTAKILRQWGYTVLEAHDGHSALSVLGRYSGPIHLLLTDVVMPDMSGPEVARRVREGRPSTKVLYMSGYTDDAVLQHGVLTRETPFLQKPFMARELAMKLREVLES
jgi:PAS domain S-box-containing protein